MEGAPRTLDAFYVCLEARHRCVSLPDWNKRPCGGTAYVEGVALARVEREGDSSSNNKEDHNLKIKALPPPLFWNAPAGMILAGPALFSFMFSLAVMVIACPCAVGLAAPTAILVRSEPFFSALLALWHGTACQDSGFVNLLSKVYLVF